MKLHRRIESKINDWLGYPDPYLEYASHVEDVWPRVKDHIWRWSWLGVLLMAGFITIAAIPNDWVPRWIAGPVAFGAFFGFLGVFAGPVLRAQVKRQIEVHRAIYERGARDTRA